MGERPVRLVGGVDQAEEELVAYCPRPKCRKEVRQVIGRGRPRTYCSDECRRLAESELRRLDLRLRHYAGVVDQVRLDIASYQRGGTDGVGDPTAEIRNAEVALGQAETALEFLADDESPTAKALRRLYEAVGPVVRGAANRQAS